MIIKNYICNLCGKPLYRGFSLECGYSQWYHPIPKDSKYCFDKWGKSISVAEYFSKLQGISKTEPQCIKTDSQSRQIVIYKNETNNIRT
jgi:hypothetical protein